jgi:hypothetical protein
MSIAWARELASSWRATPWRQPSGKIGVADLNVAIWPSAGNRLSGQISEYLSFGFRANGVHARRGSALHPHMANIVNGFDNVGARRAVPRRRVGFARG